MDSHLIEKITVFALSLTTSGALLYAFFKNLAYKNERKLKSEKMMESAHELAKKKNAHKSLAERVALSNKRHGEVPSDYPDEE